MSMSTTPSAPKLDATARRGWKRSKAHRSSLPTDQTSASACCPSTSSFIEIIFVPLRLADGLYLATRGTKDSAHRDFSQVRVPAGPQFRRVSFVLLCDLTTPASPAYQSRNAIVSGNL